MKQLKAATCVILLCLIWLSSAASKTTDEYFDKARELLDTGSYAEAAEEFRTVAKLASEDSKTAQNATYWVGQCYFRMGEYDEALSTFEQIVQNDPKSALVPVTRLMIAQTQQEKKNAKLRARIDGASDNGIVIDPKTGLEYTKIKTLTGKNDVIKNNNWLSISPNGNFLVSGNRIIPLDGGEPFHVTDVPAFSSSLSPDGAKLAFYSGGSIWMLPISPETGHPTGTAEKLLDGNYWYQRPASWSPDSKKIVFQRKDEEFSGVIYTLSIADKVLTCVTDHPVKQCIPIWSPDGKTIAYKWGPQLRMIPVEGGTPTKIGNKGLPSFPYPICWSPDSKWLIYQLAGKLTFYRVADKYEFETDALWGKVGGFFSWSPDKEKMLFYRSSYDYVSSLKVVSPAGGPSMQLGRQLTLWPYPIYWSSDSRLIITDGENKDGELVFWMIPLAGGDPIPIKMDISIEGQPKPRYLSPDRTKLAFTVKRDNETEDLFCVPISLKDGCATGPVVKMFDGWNRTFSYNMVFAWSPDGKKFALMHGWDIWLASTDGGEPVQLAVEKPRGHRMQPEWSPDGKMLIYRAYRIEQNQFLRVVSTPDSEPKVVLDIPLDGNYRYAWSPDSKEIAFFSKDVVSIIPVDGSQRRQLIDLEEFPMDSIWSISWSPGGKKLALAGANRASDETQIWMIPAEGGQPTQLVEDDSGEKYGIFWSPDGKWLAYASDRRVKTRPEGTIWAADVMEFLNKQEKE